MATNGDKGVWLSLFFCFFTFIFLDFDEIVVDDLYRESEGDFKIKSWTDLNWTEVGDQLSTKSVNDAR